MVSPLEASVAQLPTLPEPTVGGLQRAPGLLQARPCGKVLKEHDCPKACEGDTVKARPIETRLSTGREEDRFMRVLSKNCDSISESWRELIPVALARQWALEGKVGTSSSSQVGGRSLGSTEAIAKWHSCLCGLLF